MVLIEAGVFRQGRDQSEDERRYGVQSIPERAVYLDDFYIDAYEVTLERFQKYRQAMEKDGRRTPPEPLNAGAAGDQPAAGIPWAQAKGYATWSGRTLPTEAQWDKAARTSLSFTHPWGNGRAIWGKPRVPRQLDPVGSFPSDQTPQGVFDMAGNVREWCLDNYTDSFKKVSASEVVKNPDGPRAPSLKYHRVIKGGGPGWIVWHRTSAPMRTVEPDLGFRTVLPIAPGKAKDDEKKPGTTGKVGF
jgi:formylglycine-generating enzyme required for sulfatase activity